MPRCEKPFLGGLRQSYSNKRLGYRDKLEY